ncbi:hypothetical protein Bca52824_028534 [Brassica carinata]|uniref:RBR-type E3 ubiquitin transferase n=1 Tax=Brassica carinata TaxID=52824 RepID=A0A8X7VCM1_BRACI|nr:hypothetical protein Bca52824_028534 [Brassica carinata]
MDAIDRVSVVLSITEVEASVLLRYFHWSVGKVHDEWFADEEGVRNTVGILEKPVVPPSDDTELTCGICFDPYPPEKIASVSCGHPFCTTCWTVALSFMKEWESLVTSAQPLMTPGCLMLRCPDPSCLAAVGHDMVDKLASEEDKDKYNRYFLRSYIEDNRKMKWCPAPGYLPIQSLVLDASGRLKKTRAKCVLFNALKFSLVTLCLGAWMDHGERTGGFYACNRYEVAKQEGQYDETERRREMAKNSLERYTHYYERWASNQTSRQKAMTDLQQLQTHNLEKLSDKQCTPESQLKFILEAWLQIIECRRVLKWTYAYGYYLPDHEHAKRQFFEYLQGEAESGLERLHQCVEKDLLQFLNAEGPSKDFNDFRTKLAGLTRS